MNAKSDQNLPKRVMGSRTGLLEERRQYTAILELTSLRNTFFLSCVLCAHLLVLEILRDTVGVRPLIYWLWRLVPYCLFLVLVAYYARPVVRLDKKTLFMVLFLFSIFLMFLVGLAGHLGFLAGISILRPYSSALDAIFIYLELVAMFSFLAGSYYALREIYQTKFELSQEIRRLNDTEQALKRQLGFDNLVTELLGRLAWSSGVEIDACIQTALGQIAKFIGAEHSFVILVSTDSTTWSVSHEWCAPGILKRKEQYQQITTGGIRAWSEDKLRAGEVVQINRVDDFPPEAALIRQHAEAEGVKSRLSVPLLAQGNLLIGCLSLQTYSHEQQWSQEDIRQLRLIAESFVNVIKRKKAEEALRESEERFRSAFDLAAIGMALVATDGRWLRVNQSLCHIVGYSEEELLARNFQSITHPEDLEADLGLARQLLKGSIPRYHREKRYLHKQGQIVWIFLSVSLLRDEGGQPLYFISQIEDITERKRAEEELRLSEARYRAVVENQTEFIVRWRPDGTRTYANEAYRRYFNLTPEEAVSTSFMALVAEQDRAAVQAKISRLLSGNVLSETDIHRVNKQDGTVGWQEWDDQVIRDETGQIVEFQSVGRDVTERKRAEDELRSSEERFTKAFQASPDPISIYRHRDSTLLEVNERWIATFGYAREEAVGRTALEVNLAAPEERQRIRQLLEQEGSVRGYDVELRNKQGDIRHVSLSAEQIMIHGELCNIILHHDITERKRAEKQLRAISEQLRALTASVTSAREEEGIRIAREIHDELGSALTSLRWDLEDIGRIMTGSEDRSRLRALQEKTAAMMRLTDATIGVVRRISSELRPSVLDDLGLKEAIEWHAQQFQTQRGIVCRCNCAVEFLALNQEQSTAVFRIFQEALTNILRHAQATRIDIDMEEKDGEFILTIADDGKGIKDDQKSGLHSLGILGMRERARLVGGQIDITGMEGKGTVVTVRIPERAETLKTLSQ